MFTYWVIYYSGSLSVVILLCKYCNRGYLDKVDQSYHRKAGCWPISSSSLTMIKHWLLTSFKKAKSFIWECFSIQNFTYNSLETYLLDTNCNFFIYQQFLHCLCFLPPLFSVMVTYQEIKHGLTSQQVQKVTSAGRY